MKDKKIHHVANIFVRSLVNVMTLHYLCTSKEAQSPLAYILAASCIGHILYFKVKAKRMQPKAHRTGADMVAHTMSAPVFCLTANQEIMVYTFAKRKELNEMTERRYPEVSFQWQRDGLPRMHCALRPKNTEEIQSAKALEVYAYRYWTQYRKPLPVFVAMMPTKYGVEYYDVNYVSHLSPQSMAIAARYVGDHRLFAEPILLNDNT